MKRRVKVSDSDVSAGGHLQVFSSYDDGGHGDLGGKAGFSAGSGLRTIAQGSAEQANNAVANQHAAARQAAFVAKSSLAQSAVDVSKIVFERKFCINLLYILLCFTEYLTTAFNEDT